MRCLANQMSEFVVADEKVRQRALSLQKMGFHGADALHVACAEKCNVDVLLTTDDYLLKRAKLHPRLLRVQVANPLTWIEEVLRL